MGLPNKKLDWTRGNVNQGTITVEPSTAKKEMGWNVDERPPRETMNWLFWNVTEWQDYVQELGEQIEGQLGEWDAIVGAGGTHADINALMTAINTPSSGFENARNILVTTTLPTAAVQIIDVEGMNFSFKAQAGFLKNGSSIGLQIDAPRVRILNARFSSYITGGDIPLELTANAKNCFVQGCSFHNSDTDINDLGSNNVLNANLIEE